MTGADPSAQTAVCAQQVGGGGQSLSTVPIPNMAATCPSILHEVIKSNLDGATLDRSHVVWVIIIQCPGQDSDLHIARVMC